ncbi:LuxR C-terminal-related transcriptional regulator, partial [Chloroflexota bacterium]
VGEARDGIETIKKAIELEPDVIMMDIFMPNSNGIEALMAIKERVPNARVIILTVSENEDDVFQALRLGALSYLVKGTSIDDLTASVRMAAAGEVMLSPSIASRLAAEFRGKDNPPSLSPREMEVLRMVGEGMTNSEIAGQMFISESTVRTYLHRLLDKLNLRNRSEVIAYATRHHMSNNNHH